MTATKVTFTTIRHPKFPFTTSLTMMTGPSTRKNNGRIQNWCGLSMNLRTDDRGFVRHALNME